MTVSIKIEVSAENSSLFDGELERVLEGHGFVRNSNSAFQCLWRLEEALRARGQDPREIVRDFFERAQSDAMGQTDRLAAQAGAT